MGDGEHDRIGVHGNPVADSCGGRGEKYDVVQRPGRCCRSIWRVQTVHITQRAEPLWVHPFDYQTTHACEQHYRQHRDNDSEARWSFRSPLSSQRVARDRRRRLEGGHEGDGSRPGNGRNSPQRPRDEPRWACPGHVGMFESPRRSIEPLQSEISPIRSIRHCEPSPSASCRSIARTISDAVRMEGSNRSGCGANGPVGSGSGVSACVPRDMG